MSILPKMLTYFFNIDLHPLLFLGYPSCPSLFLETRKTKESLIKPYTATHTYLLLHFLRVSCSIQGLKFSGTSRAAFQAHK